MAFALVAGNADVPSQRNSSRALRYGIRITKFVPIGFQGQSDRGWT
jgi:hypothetical protein